MRDGGSGGGCDHDKAAGRDTEGVLTIGGKHL